MTDEIKDVTEFEAAKLSSSDYVKIAEDHGAKFYKNGGFWAVLDQNNNFLWEAYFNTKSAAAEAYYYRNMR